MKEVFFHIGMYMIILGVLGLLGLAAFVLTGNIPIATIFLFLMILLSIALKIKFHIHFL